MSRPTLRSLAVANIKLSDSMDDAKTIPIPDPPSLTRMLIVLYARIRRECETVIGPVWNPPSVDFHRHDKVSLCQPRGNATRQTIIAELRRKGKTQRSNQSRMMSAI